LILIGTVAAVMFGYFVRFLALSFEFVEAGLAKIVSNMNSSAKSLGHDALGTLHFVRMSTIRETILTVGKLVIIDCMHKLSLTTILRLFNFKSSALVSCQ
jgi:iron(III) transport system permease protein